MIDILIGLVTAWYLTKEKKKASGVYDDHDPTPGPLEISYNKPDEDMGDLV